MKIEKLKGLCKDCKYYRPNGFDIKLENGSFYHVGDLCTIHRQCKDSFYTCGRFRKKEVIKV